jgi:hypothetical protein
MHDCKSSGSIALGIPVTPGLVNRTAAFRGVGKLVQHTHQCGVLIVDHLVEKRSTSRATSLDRVLDATSFAAGAEDSLCMSKHSPVIAPIQLKVHGLTITYY